ncbi:MAG: hypothetical protein AAF998_23325 [Bacteroidota bacterium]
MNLFDSTSRLHNFKQRRGLNKARKSSTSAFILERQLVRRLQNEIDREGMRAIAKSMDWKVFQIRNIMEDKVLRLEKSSLDEAIEIFDRSGIGPVLRFVNYQKLLPRTNER